MSHLGLTIMSEVEVKTSKVATGSGHDVIQLDHGRNIYVKL